mmetsp:Transcript_14110/g.21545  ORF Transcript_14110/g.21545 Transcript_14110/m.21545 type:complete len:116 (+) Transcript_14110:351-698(+)
MYWIPRQDLIDVMTEAILERNSSDETNVEFCRGVQCAHIEPTDDGRVKIVCQRKNTEKGGDGNSPTESYVADFCVGADGISSKVRHVNLFKMDDFRKDGTPIRSKQNTLVHKIFV